jgi:GT2 family glycosyltransferase
MSPRVTVLLAVHDGGAFLMEAVTSVLAQTFEDLELLVVDDASTDDAVDSLPDDPRIRLLRNDRNLGQIPSLNRGLAEARGEYVARLDHDDLCLPRRLERQVEALDRDSSITLVSSWVDIVGDDGRLWFPLRGAIDSYVDFLARVLVDDLPLAHPAIMFRRDVVRELGGYDERLGAAEDKDLYRRIALSGKGAYVVPELLVVYRRHAAQMTFAKATMVNRNNEIGHDRFLAELAPDLPSATIRMLLTGDERFWEQKPLAADALDRLVDAAADRQSLSPEEARQLGRALAIRAARALIAGWASGARGYAESARPIVPFVHARGSWTSKASLALQPLLRSSAPLGRPVGSLRRAMRRILRRSELERLRQVARRSRTLRRIYTKAVGFRLTDD